MEKTIVERLQVELEARRGTYDWTALIWAAYEGHFPVVHDCTV